MKKYLILFLMFFGLTTANAQTSSLGYFNFRFGIDKIAKNVTFVENNAGLQFGYFFTDNWGLEADLQLSFKYNEMSSNRVGANVIWQNTKFHEDMTPFIKIGVAYKGFEFDKDIEEDICHGLDAKMGVGINVPVSDWISLNFGVNYHHFFAGKGWGMVSKDNIETELGICLLLY